MTHLDEGPPDGWGRDWIAGARGWTADEPHGIVGVPAIPRAQGIFDTPGTFSPHTWTPGQKWAGGATPPLAEYFPVVPVALRALPYIDTRVPPSSEGDDFPFKRRTHSQTFHVQGVISTGDMVANVFSTVVSLDLTDTTAQHGFEGLLEHAVGWLSQGTGEEFVRWRVTVDGLDTPVLREWNGPWHAAFQASDDLFIRLPYLTVLRVEAAIVADFPDDYVFARIAGQVWPTNRPGHTTAGDLRR